MKEIISGHIIDPVAKHIIKGQVHIENGRITAIREDASITEQHYILPPLVDAHIHIESSMLTPGEFAKKAACHGTGAVIADPHEIANVLGVQGIDFMIKEGEKVPLAFYFGAPSCVPATPFESAGACLSAEITQTLMTRNDIHFLGEMMNFPGVIHRDAEVMAKIKHAQNNNKPIDGHAPQLTGDDLTKYIKAGISTDHEATTLPEALQKIEQGMKILIRNGSSAKDFTALHSLITSHPTDGMLCSDDLHPEDLLSGHLNIIVKRALKAGHSIFDILQYSCVTPVHHYKLDIGLMQQGDPADFIVVDNLENFSVLHHYAKGVKIAEAGLPLFTATTPQPLNNFNAQAAKLDDFKIPAATGSMQVIQVKDGELVTENSTHPAKITKGYCDADPDQDLLKICVMNRYKPSKPAMGFVSGFGLKHGAFAASVAHDSHNIIGIGCTDEALLAAMNEVVRCTGGIAVNIGEELLSLPLPVAGLMGLHDCSTMAEQHSKLEQLVKDNGCHLTAPFMTMSFLALPVIPHLKITDKGLFNVDRFEFTPLFQDNTPLCPE